jgi:hypothetical protein
MLRDSGVRFVAVTMPEANDLIFGNIALVAQAHLGTSIKCGAVTSSKPNNAEKQIGTQSFFRKRPAAKAASRIPNPRCKAGISF